MTGIDKASAAVQVAASTGYADQGYWGRVLHRFLREKVSLFCLGVLAVLWLSALFAPILAPHDPYESSIFLRLKPIGTEGHLLGTDELGRDILSRLMYGGRLSLMMGVLPVLNAFVIGSLLGVVAGYVGGRVNMAIMRMMDVFYAFPSVLLAVAISGALGAGIENAVLSLTIVFIAPIARVAESVTSQIRGLEYVDAARISGAGPISIIREHVLGNVLGPVFVYATSLVAVSMILASGLSFLGLGAKPPEPEWGLMLNTLRTAIYQQPLVAALPGVLVFISSICFNLMADGIRSAMDVKQ
ncbi:MAG: ABC transporter permease [Pseudomonadota bacterium]|nr:ABC transporter permease [Pseudomonadota bacterium]